MISVSSQYKEIMSRPTRNRAFLSVGIGIIDQNAQASGTANGAFAYWSKGNIFDANKKNIEYATLEENYMKADGEMLFLPENNELMQLNTNGIATDSIMGPVRIDFPQMYDIKGLTINFGSAYPTELQIETAEKTLDYVNDSSQFVTTDVLGDTDFIIIRPISMVGGQQRFRIQNILMGVGLSYMNEQTKSFTHKDFCSTISDELPSENTSFTFFDEENRFNVDDDNSFMAYLEEMQKVTISFGLELDNGSVEWHQIATNYLKSWKSQNGVVSMTATDRLAQMKEKYEKGFKIYKRTAYEEAESILIDAGLNPDEYYIDDYLKDVVLTNPMPKKNHKTCLQLLANACRCILKQDENGRIIIKANFANVIDPEDITVLTNGHTKWSEPSNIIIGSEIVYADLTKDFLKANGKMYFLPEDETYLDTGYVSEQVADAIGNFYKNLLDCSGLTEQTINGVTFTPIYNANGLLEYINVNGTATANANYRIRNNNLGYLTLSKGTYTLTGCPQGGSSSTYMLQVSDANWNVPYFFDIGSDITFANGNGRTITLAKDTEYVNFRIYIVSGYTANNLKFYPMLRKTETKDSSYLPYQENPSITIQLPAAYTYYGVNIDFGGNPPSKMIVHTYKYEELIESVSFTDIVDKNFLIHEFKDFDKMIFEFTKGYPENHVIVNRISFGDLSDYTLTKLDWMKFPVGYKETRTKLLRVKIFSYANDDNGNPKEIEDEVFAERIIGAVGVTKTLQNPLISTEEHAQLLAEWIGNYYANNVYYTVKYRGEPRVSSADIIHAYSDIKNNMQVEVTQNDISFNGTFSGNMEYRRALKMM